MKCHPAFALAIFSLFQLTAARADSFGDKAKETVITKEIKFDEASPKEVADFITKESGIPAVFDTKAKLDTHISMEVLPQPVTADDALQYLALLGNFALSYEKDGAHFAPNTGKEAAEPAGDNWVRMVAAKPFSNSMGAGMAIFVRYSLAKDGNGIFAVPFYKDKQSPEPVMGSAPLKAGTGGCVRGFFSPGATLPVDSVRVLTQGSAGELKADFPVKFDGTVPFNVVQDLSQFKTPGSLWLYILNLQNHAGRTEDAMKETAHNIHLAAVDFAKRFPKSPTIWDVKLLDARLTIAGIAAGDKAAGDKDTGTAAAEAELRDIVAAPDASDDAKTEAALNLTLIAIKNAPDDAALAAAVTAYRHDHAADWDEETLISLMRARFARGEEPKMEPALNILVKSDDGELASQATDLLRFATSGPRVAALKTTPLEMKFTALDGTEVDLSKMRGKVVLIDFWATWCGPCMARMPEVLAAYGKYHDKGFDIVGISLDTDKDAVIRVTDARGMSWPQYFDGKRFSNEISSSYGIEEIPAMWLVDKKGMVTQINIRQANIGLESAIEKMLAE